MKTRWFPIAVVAGALAFLLAFSGSGLAARKTCDDGSFPPCRDTGEEVGNNLSLPGILTDTSVNVEAFWDPPADPELGTHYSYGCAKEEISGIYSYPNTSCVNDLMNPGNYLDAEACTASGAPCEGLPVSRIYWQKVDANNWSADSDGIAGPANVAYVDWGDALEARPWTETSKIRVETQPYSSQIAGFDPAFSTCEEAANTAGQNAVDVCKVGFQMWHVSGQGTTEQWGVRAEGSVSYNYDSPFQIINTGTARLNIAKMESGTAECPVEGGGDEGEVVILQQSVPPPLVDWTGSGWNGACTLLDAVYSVELSVGGKYVYGYNWDMKPVTPESICGWEKTGWWRLTFYAPPNAVVFNDDNAPVTAPPAVAAMLRAVPRTEYVSELGPTGPEPTEAMFTPVVDTGYNLTYIDLCIVAKGGGGTGKNK